MFLPRAPSAGGIFAVHTWIVFKKRGASRYTRYDYTAWGNPIRADGFAADARWFGALPQTVVSIDGDEASRLIPKIRGVIENYRFNAYGDYNAWPGANSNAFVQAVLASVPELKVVLPPTAIGKDHPYRGNWYGLTSSRRGIYLSLGGDFGLTIGWVEGLEMNFSAQCWVSIFGGPARPPDLSEDDVLRLIVAIAVCSRLRSADAEAAEYCELVPSGMVIPDAAPDSIPRTALDAIAIQAEVARGWKSDRAAIGNHTRTWPEVEIQYPGGNISRFRKAGADATHWERNGHRRATTVPVVALANVLDDPFGKMN